MDEQEKQARRDAVVLSIAVLSKAATRTGDSIIQTALIHASVTIMMLAEDLSISLPDSPTSMLAEIERLEREGV